MVAFAGGEPIGVLIGAKRPSGTLIHRIAVHPDHRRQGHGGHLLTSLSSKLAILGPPRIVAEVPEAFVEASRLFEASGYVHETVLTDYVWISREDERSEVAGRFLIPVTVDDLAANGLLDGEQPQTCWERSVETLTARKDEISGLAIASEERIEAYVLYVEDEVVALRTLVEDEGARLNQLLGRLGEAGVETFRIPRVHPVEISTALLETLGFRPAGGHRLYATKARA
jgi:hypothetical protein